MLKRTLCVGLATIMAAAAVLALAGGDLAAQSSAPAPPAYVGSQLCTACHEPETAAWRGSHHALAWTEPTPETVLGDFDDAVFEHHVITTRFFRRDGAYFVETDGPDGESTTYDVKGVAGIAPLQQYLVETEPGRIQALDTAWDTEQRRWYHLYPDQQLFAGDGLHWTGPYKSWNARCAECHATGFEKNYDPQARIYQSRQAEIGVGCEACHGPGSVHLDWAKGMSVPSGRGLTETGLTIDMASSDPEVQIQQCAGCHARRETLGANSPLPGTPFHDAYNLALLRPGLYHPDGSILDEVYVYGSFLQSKMYASGVRCSDCHDPHSAELIAEDNAVCTQCHSPAGNPRFPTLRLADYDTPEHHFHEPGTAGAQCKSCHMIERTYMQVDGRRDHSFRIPRPDLSAKTGAPNACSDCHADRSSEWAAIEIATRFPDSENRGRHFSQDLAFARTSPLGNDSALLDVAEDAGTAGIVRATALEAVRDGSDPETLARTAALLADPDPLVRRAAVNLQRGAPPADKAERLLPMLEDPARSVRIAAVRALLGAPGARLPDAAARALNRASDEYRASLTAKLDFPEIHMVLAGTALVMRNTRAAEAAFREAVTLDPQLVDAWVMIVRIREAVGNIAGAREALESALRINPESPALLELQQRLAP